MDIKALYRDLLQHKYSAIIKTLPEYDRLKLLEYAQNVHTHAQLRINNLIDPDNPYDWPYQLPLVSIQNRLKDWLSTSGRIIYLLQEQPREEVAPDIKKKVVTDFKPASAEVCALYHYIVEILLQIPNVKPIPFGREKEGGAIGRELYGVDGERFYKAYKKLLRLNPKTGAPAYIKDRKPYMKKKIKKQTVALADKFGHIEYKGWWKTVIE